MNHPVFLFLLLTTLAAESGGGVRGLTETQRIVTGERGADPGEEKKSSNTTTTTHPQHLLDTQTFINTQYKSGRNNIKMSISQLPR